MSIRVYINNDSAVGFPTNVNPLEPGSKLLLKKKISDISVTPGQVDTTVYGLWYCASNGSKEVYAWQEGVSTSNQGRLRLEMGELVDGVYEKTMIDLSSHPPLRLNINVTPNDTGNFSSFSSNRIVYDPIEDKFVMRVFSPTFAIQYLLKLDPTSLAVTLTQLPSSGGLTTANHVVVADNISYGAQIAPPTLSQSTTRQVFASNLSSGAFKTINVSGLPSADPNIWANAFMGKLPSIGKHVIMVPSVPVNGPAADFNKKKIFFLDPHTEVSSSVAPLLDINFILSATTIPGLVPAFDRFGFLGNSGSSENRYAEMENGNMLMMTTMSYKNNSNVILGYLVYLMLINPNTAQVLDYKLLTPSLINGGYPEMVKVDDNNCVLLNVGEDAQNTPYRSIKNVFVNVANDAITIGDKVAPFAVTNLAEGESFHQWTCAVYNAQHEYIAACSDFGLWRLETPTISTSRRAQPSLTEVAGSNKGRVKCQALDETSYDDFALAINLISDFKMDAVYSAMFIPPTSKDMNPFSVTVMVQKDSNGALPASNMLINLATEESIEDSGQGKSNRAGIWTYSSWTPVSFMPTNSPLAAPGMVVQFLPLDE